MNKHDLAVAYLDALTEWRKVAATEPNPGYGPDEGTPEEGREWLAWHAKSAPILDRSIDLARKFAEAAGIDSTHPFNLEPIAKQLAEG